MTINRLPDKRLVDEGTERAILACIMQEPSKMIDASAKLRTEDFVNDNNRYLYDIMLAVFNDNGGKATRYDISYLMSLAKQRGAEDKFIQASGGEQYIAYLNMVRESYIDLGSFESYTDRVASLSTKRKLFDTTEDFREEILESDKSPEELMVKEQNDLNNILITTSHDGNVLYNLADKSSEFIDNAFLNKREILGIKTLFPQLDKTIEGLKRGNLLIVAAPKKTGKSAFLMNIGLNVSIKQKIPTLMISTEMSDEEILSRSLANISNLPEKKIQKGFLSPQEKKILFAAQEQLKAGKFYHLCMRGFTLEKIIGLIRKFVNNIVGFQPDGKPHECLVIFDYIKMPSVGLSSSAEQKEYKVLGSIADGLKIVAGDLNIPIFTACQTNRGGDVANSYEITWFCNTFMTLVNKSNGQIEKDKNTGGFQGNQLLKITDNRGGEENHEGISFDYNKPMLKYNEVTPRPYNGASQQANGSY